MSKSWLTKPLCQVPETADLPHLQVGCAQGSSHSTWSRSSSACSGDLKELLTVINFSIPYKVEYLDLLRFITSLLLQAIFHQQMAALRAQLEAMQAQRQQGAAAPGAAAQGAAGAQQAAPAQAPAAVQQNLLQMMLAAQQAAQQAAAAPQQPAGAGAAAPRQQPQPAATSAAPTPAAAGASPLPPGGATGARPPFPFPPFPFLPFTTPPPMPPPNFEGLSTAELAAMEGQERTAVEARIRCLRNIQVNTILVLILEHYH